MTYFDPKFYNKENLKEKDRNELEWWYTFVTNAIDFVQGDNIDLGGSTLDKIKEEIIDEFVDELKIHTALEFNQLVVATIDHYDEYAKELEEYTQFGDELDDEEE